MGKGRKMGLLETNSGCYNQLFELLAVYCASDCLNLVKSQVKTLLWIPV